MLTYTPSQTKMSSDLPPEAIAFASRMYDAARAGQVDVFQQALPAGLPPNLTNDKGDTLVGYIEQHTIVYVEQNLTEE